MDNPPEIIKTKSKQLIAIGIKAANSAFERGLSEEDCLFAALSSVTNYERLHNPALKLNKQKSKPLHLTAVLEQASLLKQKQEAEAQVAIENERIAQEELKKRIRDEIKVTPCIIDVQVTDKGVTLIYSDGKRVNKKLNNETYIQNTIITPSATNETQQVEELFTKRIDFINDNLFYKGEAAPGSTESAAAWRISLVSIAADGDVTETWASGNANFTKSWTDRLSYTYS